MFLKKIFKATNNTHSKNSASPYTSAALYITLCLKRAFKYSCQQLHRQISEVGCKGNTAVPQPIRYQHMKSGVTTTALV